MINKKTKEPIFVVQEHDATTLHYDFRLEDERVLKSWALPKGPSMNPKEKHLAIETPDHPLNYQNFEGIIPQGSYGAGSVIVWDKGTFKNLRDKSLSQSIEEGKVEIFLNGKKLKGTFTLVKTKYQNNSKNWLFIKVKDEYSTKNNEIKSRADKLKEKSVLSDKTLEQLNKQLSKEGNNGNKNKKNNK